MKEIILKILSVFFTFPKPNEQWQLRGENDDDPWEQPTRCLATIRDVKKGWVRYRLGDGSYYPDERKTILMFISVYRKADNEYEGRNINFPV